MSESSQFQFTATGTDPICRHCGRPVIGASVWGNVGPYHPACVQPPQAPKHFGMTDGTFQSDRMSAALNKAREALEQLAAIRDFKGFKYPAYGPDVCRIAAEALAEIGKVGK